jgi:hypothetical protein
VLGSCPNTRSAPPVAGETQPTHLHRRGLARAVGPEEAKRPSPLHREVDSVISGEVAEGLGQASGLEQDGGARIRHHLNAIP